MLGSNIARFVHVLFFSVHTSPLPSIVFAKKYSGDPYFEGTGTYVIFLASRSNGFCPFVRIWITPLIPYCCWECKAKSCIKTRKKIYKMAGKLNMRYKYAAMRSMSIYDLLVSSRIRERRKDQFWQYISILFRKLEFPCSVLSSKRRIL